MIYHESWVASGLISILDKRKAEYLDYGESKVKAEKSGNRARGVGWKLGKNVWHRLVTAEWLKKNHKLSQNIYIP